MAQMQHAQAQQGQAQARAQAQAEGTAAPSSGGSGGGGSTAGAARKSRSRSRSACAPSGAVQTKPSRPIARTVLEKAAARKDAAPRSTSPHANPAAQLRSAALEG